MDIEIGVDTQRRESYVGMTQKAMLISWVRWATGT